MTRPDPAEADAGDPRPAVRTSLGDDACAGESLLRRLSGHGPIAAATALVVAHPDDESIAMAGLMTRFTDLTLIHLTDGAPDRGSEGERCEVASLRRAETDRAIEAAQARPRRLLYAMTDGRVSDELAALIERLGRDIADAEVVVTHAFEGGHIDHDACAIAVQVACDRLRVQGRHPPARLEFAGYHACRGQVRSGEFSRDERFQPITLRLGAAAAARREAAFACHQSQERNLRWFSLIQESFRVAPDYPLGMPPPSGETLYGAVAGAHLRDAAMRVADPGRVCDAQG